MEYIHHCDTPLGAVTLASDGRALTGLWFDGQRHFARTLDPCHQPCRHPVFDDAERWLALYFNRHVPGFTPPLAPKGTPFQLAVWAILQTVPYGQTVTYGEIARCIAVRTGLSTMSAQAVGGAVGRNPISLIIPCHRVLGAGGSLTGYAGGTARKQALLALERGCPLSFAKDD